MTNQQDLPSIDRYTVGLPDAPARDERRWDPHNPGRTGTGGPDGWLPGMPQPGPQGNWQRMALEEQAMSARSALTIGMVATARRSLSDAQKVLQAAENAIADVESRRDAAWRAALAEATLLGALLPRDALEGALLSELERTGVVGSMKHREAYAAAYARAVRTPAMAEAVLDRLAELLERSAPALLEDAPEPTVAQVPA